MKRRVMNIDEIREMNTYFGKKYDIDGNIYEFIDYFPNSHSLYFQSVNNDAVLLRHVDKVNLDEYIQEE